MKDQLITLLEALRLAKAELMTHDTRRVKNAPRTISTPERNSVRRPIDGGFALTWTRRGRAKRYSAPRGRRSQ
jgi:hypothetical protein